MVIYRHEAFSTTQAADTARQLILCVSSGRLLTIRAFDRFDYLMLGVAHLADKMCNRAFDKGGRKGLGLAERDYLHESLVLAGLCHDLGHGPFSHTFDNVVIPQLQENTKWSHEVASEMLLDDLIDTYNIDIEGHQVNFIKGLIAGERKVNYDIGSIN